MSSPRPTFSIALSAWLRTFWPAPTSVNAIERLRACAGALLGIGLTGGASAWLLGAQAGTLWLMAPMGASAVLLFAVPSSPLAQPWSVVGGNTLAACIGVACSQLIGPRGAAAAVAIAVAIVAMFLLRCLHPPSGAVALTAVLGGPAVQAAGYGFVLTPVLLNSLLILGVALVYNNATGRRYPQTQQFARRPAPPGAALGYTAPDLQAALRSDNQVLDIGPAQLERVLRQLELQAFDRHAGGVRCGQLLRGPALSVDFATELSEAWTLLQTHGMTALPVVDRWQRVIGIVTRGDVLRHAELRELTGLLPRLRNYLRRTPHTHSDKHEVVGQIMSAPVRTVLDSAPLVALVPWMAEAGLHQVPVVSDERRLVGLLTQTDLVGALVKTRAAGA